MSLELSQAEAEDFLIHDALLLDERRFDEWLELFADNGIYWIPSAGDDPDNDTSIVYDNDEVRRMRIRRFESRHNWSQDPPSRTLHTISNVRVEMSETGEPVVYSSQVIFAARVNHTSILPARCVHRLEQVNGSWKIALRKVQLLDPFQFMENLSFPI